MHGCHSNHSAGRSDCASDDGADVMSPMSYAVSSEQGSSASCGCFASTLSSCRFSSIGSPRLSAPDVRRTFSSSSVMEVTSVASSSSVVSSNPFVGAPCACNKTLSLYSHNVFFLPSVARYLTSGPDALRRDQLRAQWLCDKIVAERYDIVCLQEMFREGPTDLVRERLSAAGYHVRARFNESGWVTTHSGLFFASRYPILHYDFHEFTHATLGTSDYFARKGVGCAVIDVGCGKHAAVFFTHTQAEESGANERQAQLQRCVIWMCKKLKLLQKKRIINLHSTAVLLAGDLNVDGKLCIAGLCDDTAQPSSAQPSFASSAAAASNDSFNSEFEAMLHSMKHPHDLLSYSLGEDALHVETNDSGRLDYIFSWRLCDGTSVSSTRTAAQTSLIHPKKSAHTDTAATMAVMAALAFPVSLPAASVIAAMAALALIPQETRRCTEEEQLYAEAQAVLASSALLHVGKCDTETDWEVEPGHPASDHHPLILRFSIHSAA